MLQSFHTQLYIKSEKKLFFKDLIFLYIQKSLFFKLKMYLDLNNWKLI